MRDWYKEIGFKNNPFSIKPNNNLFGVENKIKKIIKLIKAGESCFISGDYGSGKTTALKKIINEYAGENKLMYVNFDSNAKSVNFKKLLIGRSNLFKRLIKIKAKEAILLADEVQDMTLKDAKQIKNYREKGNIDSIIFVGIKLPKELIDFVGENNFEFKGLDNNSAIKLTKSRIGESRIISDEKIKLINKKSNNPRDFLKNLEDIFRFAIDSGNKYISKEHIRKVLG